jgi:hypothetical protein
MRRPERFPLDREFAPLLFRVRDDGVDDGVVPELPLDLAHGAQAEHQVRPARVRGPTAVREHHVLEPTQVARGEEAPLSRALVPPRGGFLHRRERLPQTAAAVLQRKRRPVRAVRPERREG